MSPSQFHAKKDFTTTTMNNNMPPPLKINKDSHLIKKSSSLSSSSPPSSSSTSSSSTSSSSMINTTGMAPRAVASNKPPQRHPVIIYTHSPKVIHTHPRDFMALVQKLTGQSRSEDDGGGSSNNPPPPRQPKQEPVSNRRNVMIGNEDNETPSVVTEDNNCSSSIGESQVNSCFVGAPLIMEPPMNPYMANLPVFPPPSSSEFMYPSQPLLNYSNSLFFSHNMRTSLEGVNEFQEF